MRKSSKHVRKGALKHWKPFFHEDGIATLYHLGCKLFDTGLKGGYSKQTRCKYESPNALRELRAQRRQAAERSIRKRFQFLTFQNYIDGSFVHGNFEDPNSIQPTISQTRWEIFFVDIRVLQPDHDTLEESYVPNVPETKNARTTTDF